MNRLLIIFLVVFVAVSVVSTSTSNFRANAKDLKVHHASLYVNNQLKYNFQNITYDKENDYVIFHLENDKNLKDVLNLQVNDVFTLSLTLTGELNDKMTGFYRSKYYKEGEEKYAASTQFEPVSARRAFVCWDEPAIKAIFEVTLIVPKHLMALSNTECVEDTTVDNKNDLKVNKFAPSPLMSTYLVAFVIGEYDYVEKIAEDTKNKVKVRVYCPLGKKAQGLFALDVAIKVLALFENYFELSYPLKKLDMIAISSFSSGAMENFGLITFRESALLVDPNNSSTFVKQYVATVVAHEISHQWFGNLVTMKWWDGLWLNEGFATWCESFAIDKLYPEWKVIEQSVRDDFYKAMSFDSLQSSHPIEVPIKIAAEVDEIFDSITYSKGCIVLRMLVNYLGFETFRKGIVHYLNKFKWSNADTQQLWTSLSEISGKNVCGMMSNWTKKAGYPIVVVEAAAVDNKQNETTTLRLSQNRFTLSSGLNTLDTTIWSIPVSYTLCNEGNEIIENQFLLKEREINLTIPSHYKWFKLNTNQTGFYRVMYNLKGYYSKLIEPIKFQRLSTIDRMSVLEDITTLAKSNVISTDNVLALLKAAYTKENEYLVISTVTSVVANIYNLIKDEEERVLDKYNKFAKELFIEMGTKLGWTAHENENYLTQLTRPLVIGSLLKYRDELTIKNALQKFEELQKDINQVIPDLRVAVYCAKIKYGGKEGYENVLQMYNNTDFNEEKVRVLQCLGETQDEMLIKKTLLMTLDGSVKSQDTTYLLSGTSLNPKATLICWNFLKENFTQLKEKYKGSETLFGRLIKLFVSGITDITLVKKVKAFLEKRITKSTRRSIEQAIEIITLNSRWKNNAITNTISWLDNN